MVDRGNERAKMYCIQNAAGATTIAPPLLIFFDNGWLWGVVRRVYRPFFRIAVGNRYGRRVYRYDGLAFEDAARRARIAGARPATALIAVQVWTIPTHTLRLLLTEPICLAILTLSNYRRLKPGSLYVCRFADNANI